MACDLPTPWIQRIHDGYHPGRSGHLQIVLEPPNYFGQFLHSGPYPYLQRVPMFLYGPGHVPAVGRVTRPVRMTDLAPTYARYLGFRFPARDGQPLEEAIAPGTGPPKLILTVVWDGAGRNVLDEHPDAWPTLGRLIDEGAWYENATVGSSPSVTPTVHTTIGTGALPRNHGLIDLRFLVGDRLVGTRGVSSRYLRIPTLADRYDRARDNRAEIGIVASGGTLGMIGKGALFEGGDRDVAILDFRGNWGLSDKHEDYFRYAPYAEEDNGLSDALRELDLEDGQLDGRWLGEPVLAEREDISMTPAYSVHQRMLLERVIRTEGFGADDVPDLLYTNFKQIDLVGHRWSMNSPQMEAVVRSSDRALKDLIRALDREVGRGEWVLALTADHGSTPNRTVTGAFYVDLAAFTADLEAAFDGDGDERQAIRSVRVTQVWLDEDELAENGHTTSDVASFVMDYTLGDNVADPATLPARDRDSPVFAAAFPSAVLEDLPCLDRGGPG